MNFRIPHLRIGLLIAMLLGFQTANADVSLEKPFVFKPASPRQVFESTTSLEALLKQLTEKAGITKHLGVLKEQFPQEEKPGIERRTCDVRLNKLSFDQTILFLDLVDGQRLGMSNLTVSMHWDPPTDAQSAQLLDFHMKTYGYFAAASYLKNPDATHEIPSESSLSPADILRFIDTRLTKNKSLNLSSHGLTINILNNFVRLEGVTQSYADVDRIKSLLEKVPEFKAVTSNNVRRGVTSDVILFSISFEINET